MMNVNTMRIVVDPFEEKKKDPTSEAAVALWKNDEGSLRYVRSSANFVFRFQQDGEWRFLRIAHASERTLEAINAELDFVLYLADEGLPVARPLISKEGRIVEEFQNQNGLFRAVAFEKAPGRYLPISDFGERSFRDWGRTMGLLHEAATRFKPRPDGKRHDWKADVAMAETWIPDEETEAHRGLDSLSEWLSTLPEEGEDFGLIHFDLEVDNMTWDGERFSVFDFDDAAYYWFAMDVAAALQEPFEQRPEPKPQIIKWFLDGYRSAKTFDAEWVKTIPRFATLGKIIKFAKMNRAYSGVEPDRDPEWVATMRRRHGRHPAQARKSFSLFPERGGQ